MDGGHSFHFSKVPGESSVPHYDKDDFRSFATLFRKIDSDGERTNIFKVMKILKRYASENERGSFDRIKAQLRHEAEHPTVAVVVGTTEAKESLSPRKIRNIIFNGQIFHSDPALQDSLSQILKFEPFVMVAFVCYAIVLVDVATDYARGIRFVNFFREPTVQ